VSWLSCRGSVFFLSVDTQTLKSGADIGIVDKNVEGAKSTADEIARLGVRTASAGADVNDEAQSEAAFAATLGDIDNLCNNAGIGTSSPFSKMSL
jgi:NAD(P)-dependent dehydrogenase (short-subunit alcohol dehydrogenase family)